MPRSSTNYGWSVPILGDQQGTAELLVTAVVDAIDAQVAAVADPSRYAVPGSTQHVAATLAALLDDLYGRFYLLARTTAYDVLDGAGDTVLSAAGDTVIVRH